MKREECSKCLRPIAACFCPHIAYTQNRTPILILQHPTEKKHPLNTIKIAQMSFSNITVLVGEDFSDSLELKKFMAEHSAHLIFPTQDSHSAVTPTQKQEIEAIILIDGTWKKAKKIYYQTICLHHLTAIHLDLKSPSIYKIRKEPKEFYLSSLETIVTLLERIEQKSFQDVLNPMRFQIEYQIQKMGSITYQENYLGRKS